MSLLLSARTETSTLQSSLEINESVSESVKHESKPKHKCMIPNGFSQQYDDELAVSETKQVQGHTTDVNLPR